MGPTLSPRQRRSLEAICDTFCPSADEGLPSATELGVPDAVLGFLARDPRIAPTRDLKRLLDVWDTAVLTALGGGGLTRFSALPRAQREQVLLRWCDSRLTQRRAAFHGLKRAALTAYYGLPGPDGGRNPALEAMDYPGAPGKPENAPAKALTPLPIMESTTLDCDVCIVGSGAGGGVAAAVLSAAGLDVVVLERGGYYDDEDFDGGELSAFADMYSGSPAATDDGSVALVAGACLGGGTVVNYSTSFRTPDDVRAEWASHGVPAFASADFSASLDAVCERLSVSQEHNEPSLREQKLRDACIALGWHLDAMPRNVTSACDQGRDCGYCGFGCRRGAKQSTTKTWLRDAQAKEARIVVGVDVKRVIVEGGAARGVSAVTDAGHRLTVRSRAVVAACGAIHTPALLKRSGLTNPNVGRYLRVHPVTAVWGIYDDEIRPWEGTMQALYSDQHRDLDGGYGLKYETAAGHPALGVGYMPWRSARAHQELMQALSHVNVFGILLRDRDGGEVRVDRDGEPVVRYRLSDYDARHLRVGIEGAAELHEAAGAERIFSSHSDWVAYEPGRQGAGGRAQFMRDADACGYGPGQIQLGSFHLMGSARMGGSPTTSACDPNAQTWDVRDLYVLDGSAFPTSSGVNPQISIQSIAHMAARGLAARLS
ncbi:MAG TPA: GMC family oxidoreductase N-terminal domain-containing protein [Conexibacter sp.]|nr:GMC family oxidoreductase N-terminal domain-containing protein [Conexibacter sp.]